MIRILRALAWLRWRLLLNGFRKSRRDALERASRLAAFVVPAALAILAIPSVLTLAVAALAAGWLADSSDTARTVLAIVPRAILAVLTFAVLIGPLVRSMQGATIGLSRLVLLPIPRRVLHLAEIGAGLSDPWILAVLPSLAALPAGLLLSGSFAAAATMLAAGVAFALVLATLASAAWFVVALVLRDRRRGEWVSLVFIALISLSGFLPMILAPQHERRARRERAEGVPGSDRPAPVPVELPVWTRAAPSEGYGLALRRSLEGDPAGAFVPVAGLAGTAAALYVVSWLAYRRLLETPAGGGARRRAGHGGPRLSRIPGLSPAVSAVAMAEARLVLRTVRGKTAVFFTPVALGVLGFMGSHGDRLDPGNARLPLIAGAFLPFAAALISVIALHPFVLNQFATDGSGLTLEFLSPLSDRDVVRGKAAGLTLLWGLVLSLCVVVGIAVGPTAHPAYWVTAALAGGSVLALLLPAAAAFSALFPKMADLGRIGRAGNPHPTAGFAGGLLTLALSLPPAGLAVLGFLVAKSPALALVLVAGWAAVALAAGSLLLVPAAAVLARRRENLALVAQGR